MQKLLYPIDSKPPLGLSLLLAAQHLLAALGGIIAVPLVIGNVLKLPTEDTIVLVNAALLVSGVVTIIQCRGLGPVGLRLPSVMGASLIGSFVMIIGSFFMSYVRKLFLPVVTGTVVMMIGLSLIPVAVDWFAGA